MIDAHTHLDAEAFDADRSTVWARARNAGVRGAVIAGAAPSAWDRVEATARALGVVWTLGVHPWWLPDLDDAALDEALDGLAARRTPHGIGETGLDHARSRTDAARARERDVLRRHLALARERDVPVVLHCVRAYPQLLRIVRRDGLPRAGGMIHAWSGPAEWVELAVDSGLHLSFGAAVLRHRHAGEAVVRVPSHRLLVETDAPDQPATPGARGEPADLVRIAEAVASRRGESVAQVCNTTAANAVALFPGLAADG